jgi:hypothetical protein
VTTLRRDLQPCAADVVAISFAFFRIRMFSFTAIALFNTSITYAMLDLVMPFYLQHVLRLSPAHIGLVFLASPVLVVLLSPLAGASPVVSGRELPPRGESW